MLGQRELALDDYIAILRRRWWVIFISAVLAPLIVYGVSLKMPNRYTSKALVLADQQRISDTYVRPVVTEGLVERLTVMQEQILSRSRLEPLIKQFGLYKEHVGQETVEGLVGLMRADISVVPVRSVVQSREGDLPGFYIDFTADNPRLAQQVCSEITSMFIAEDLHYRERTAQGTTSFLESQLADAKGKLDEQEAKLAEFKRKNIGDLPDETDDESELAHLAEYSARSGDAGPQPAAAGLGLHRVNAGTTACRLAGIEGTKQSASANRRPGAERDGEPASGSRVPLHQRPSGYHQAESRN